MASELAKIARCFDLQERHIAEAIVGREQTKSLLAHLASVSAPDTGVAKVLLIYARMATTGCDWVDGDLSIDLVDAGDATIIEACTELGGGLRERLFSPMRFAAPLSEFARAIARVPQLISPLRKRSSARLIRLSAVEGIRRTTAPPPAVHIAEESLFLQPSRDPSPPRALSELPLPLPAAPVVSAAVPSITPPIDDLDSGWDDASDGDSGGSR